MCVCLHQVFPFFSHHSWESNECNPVYVHDRTRKQRKKVDDNRK